MKSHSDFNKLLSGENMNYTWGEVLEVFTVGNYGIVKYIKNDDRGETYYHPFINGEIADRNLRDNNDWHDTCHSYLTLESCLAGAMAYKYDGINSQAGEFFIKMIGIK